MDSRIIRAIRMFEHRISDDIEIVDISDALGLSLHHFHRLFVDETGETPAGYLRRIRHDLAAMHLRWSHTSVGVIGYNVGYRSKAAFTRSFQRHHGVSPLMFRQSFRQGSATSPPDRRVVVREVESFRLLARRYVGESHLVTDFWQDFLDRLPDGLDRPGKVLYVGMMFDDPGMTSAGKIRYECSITAPDDLPAPTGAPEDGGLYLVRTRPGLYGCLDHDGPREEVGASYYYLLDEWALNGGYTMADDPALELYTVARCRQDPAQNRRLTILIPVD